MGSTFFSLHYHIVFSTKERRAFIKPEWQPVRPYIATQEAHHRKTFLY